MKEIKRTRTVEEITGYEADDGTLFKTKEECEKYEQSAEYAVTEMFKRLCVKQPWGDTEFAECTIFEDYGYGGEEYCFVVADIKTAEDLKVANMYGKMRCPEYATTLGTELIGKRVLIAIGHEYDKAFCVRGTEEQMVEEFRETMAAYFHPEEK